MLTGSLIAQLHCPYCESHLELEEKYRAETAELEVGVVRCSCYRYPIIDGILILKQASGPADTIDPRVRHLDAGDPAAARHHALGFPEGTTPWAELAGRLSELLGRRGPNPMQELDRMIRDGALPVHEALRHLRPRAYGEYLFYRYANRSFLAAVALILLLESAPRWTAAAATPPGTASQPSAEPTSPETARILDLACGIGHASFLIQTVSPRASLVAADLDFVNLFIARRCMVPDAIFICLDAEVPLPFPRAFFRYVFSSDAFHYIRSKVALLKELDRVVEHDGLWLFAHLHNALARNVAPGIPLSPEHYRRCFALRPARLLVEADLIRGLVDHGVVDLQVDSSDAELRAAPAFSLVATTRAAAWRRHTDLWRPLLQASGTLRVNPLYETRRASGRTTFRIKWPSPGFRAECGDVTEYLPEECHVPDSVWERIGRERTGSDADTTVEELLKSLVLIHSPIGYSGREQGPWRQG